MHIQILNLLSWHQKTNLFRTLLYLTIIKINMQMLEVPKPTYNVIKTFWYPGMGTKYRYKMIHIKKI
jgi:hypothetical protein